MAPKRKFLNFCNFLEINTHNFVYIHPKFENKGLFHARFYRAWHGKMLDPKAVTFVVWSLKTSLGQLGPRRRRGGVEEFPEGYWRNSMWKFQGSNLKSTRLSGSDQKKSCGILRSLGFWPWNFEGVSHNSVSSVFCCALGQLS